MQCRPIKDGAPVGVFPLPLPQNRSCYVCGEPLASLLRADDPRITGIQGQTAPASDKALQCMQWPVVMLNCGHAFHKPCLLNEMTGFFETSRGKFEQQAREHEEGKPVLRRRAKEVKASTWLRSLTRKERDELGMLGRPTAASCTLQVPGNERPLCPASGLCGVPEHKLDVEDASWAYSQTQTAPYKWMRPERTREIEINGQRRAGVTHGQHDGFLDAAEQRRRALRTSDDPPTGVQDERVLANEAYAAFFDKAERCINELRNNDRQTRLVSGDPERADKATSPYPTSPVTPRTYPEPPKAPASRTDNKDGAGPSTSSQSPSEPQDPEYKTGPELSPAPTPVVVPPPVLLPEAQSSTRTPTPPRAPTPPPAPATTTIRVRGFELSTDPNKRTVLTPDEMAQLDINWVGRKPTTPSFDAVGVSFAETNHTFVASRGEDGNYRLYVLRVPRYQIKLLLARY